MSCIHLLVLIIIMNYYGDVFYWSICTYMVMNYYGDNYHSNFILYIVIVIVNFHIDNYLWENEYDISVRINGYYLRNNVKNAS